MKICQTTYRGCHKSPEPGLPTRLVDLGKDDNDIVRPHITEPGDVGPYVALIYCWSGQQNLTTTVANLDDRLGGIDWHQIPQIMRDATNLTRRLGVRYIWIDALCIIQNDPKDWNKEAQRMTDVYKGTHLVISGTRAGDVSKTLFGPRKGSRAKYNTLAPASFKVDILDVHSRGATSSVHVRECLPHEMFKETRAQDFKRHPLLARVWALQERLLATRTVHFTSNEVIWECEETFWCECDNGELGNEKSLLRQALDDSEGAFEKWKGIVEGYTRRALT
jgi:hypothetical protein